MVLVVMLLQVHVTVIALVTFVIFVGSVLFPNLRWIYESHIENEKFQQKTKKQHGTKG